MKIMDPKSSKNPYDLHLEDARELGKIIPDNAIDVTITSPPYFDLKDYGFDKGKQIGQNQSYERYLGDLEKIFNDCYDKTEDTGSLWIIVDTFKKNGGMKTLPFDLAEKVQTKERWKLKDIIIWNKTKTLPWSHKGKLRNIFEYILFFTKTDEFKYYIDRIRELKGLKKWWVKYPERYNPKGKVPGNIWEFTIPTQGWKNGFARHFCPFPPRLVERIITLTTDKKDVVLDPFAGSGVVLAQAKYMNRKYIGFELNEEYVDLFHKNVLPKTKEIAGEIKKERRERKKAIEILRRWIKELRLVKYPKTLVKQMLKKEDKNELPISSIFAITTDSEREYSDPPKEEVYLIYDGSINKEKLWSTIREVKSESPLSIFGVEANIHLLGRSSFLRKKDQYKDERFWLYSSKINKSVEEISFENWMRKSRASAWNTYSKNGVPPIISNVKNYQEVREIQNYQDIISYQEDYYEEIYRDLLSY